MDVKTKKSNQKNIKKQQKPEENIKKSLSAPVAKSSTSKKHLENVDLKTKTTGSASKPNWQSMCLIKNDDKQKPKIVSTESSNTSLQLISPMRFVELTRQADEAISQGKTFVLRPGLGHEIVRTTFLQHGWIELESKHFKQLNECKKRNSYDIICETLPKRQENETDSEYIKRCENYTLSRLIEHKPVDLIWMFGRNRYDFWCQSINHNIKLNKIFTIPFSTKGGLQRQLRNLVWISDPQLAEVNFPRTYFPGESDEMEEFLANYKSTACISFLKYCIEQCKKSNWEAIFQKGSNGEIPYSAFEFALRHCYKLLSFYSHNDIDLVAKSLNTTKTIYADEEWKEFYKHFTTLIHGEGTVSLEYNFEVDSTLRNAEMLLMSLKSYWTQYDLDGYHNLWILKPNLENRGRGILITNDLKRIQELFVTTKKRYIVQKYLERPLLIHNTKFDIRQWFIITSVNPLEIWMYKENYLRFSTQVYSLTNLHESVHVTNHCIQRKYSVNVNRDGRLPKRNMWDSYTFQAYLRQIGKGELYSSKVYAGIKKAIIGTLLASQPNMSQPPNSFELFGADFMISEDLTPWLIEINSCPDLSLSCNVTARLVPRVIEDMLKVVIDRRTNPNCNVGNFELIYQQTETLKPNILFNLRIRGHQLQPNDIVRREMYDHLLQKSVTQLSAARRVLSEPASNFQVKQSFHTMDTQRNLFHAMQSTNGLISIEKSTLSKKLTDVKNKQKS